MLPEHMLLDYALLRQIWWVLLGVLLIGFAVTDGFDLGVAGWLPFIARKDDERRIVINTIGPVWEGNQVWFILGGGAVFAAWPYVYAVSFSGFYLAMFAVLVTLILRPVAIKFRSKFVSPAMRSTWDWVLSICGLLTMTLLGVAVGNALQGVPFGFDDDMRLTYTGGLIDLINPFGVLCGLVSLSMLLMHGAVYLTLKTEAIIAVRARTYGLISAVLTLALFIAGGVFANALPGFHIAGNYMLTDPSNPLHKIVVQQTGALLSNYHTYPWMMVAPVLGIFAVLLAIMGLTVRNGWIAMIGSGMGVAGIVATAGVSMYPFILPSSTHPGHSLTVYDASSSQLTLMIMLIAVVIFVPIILAYTSWVYRVLWGRVTHETVTAEDQSY